MSQAFLSVAFDGVRRRMCVPAVIVVTTVYPGLKKRYVQEWVFRSVNFLLIERGLLRHSCSFTVIC